MSINAPVQKTMQQTVHTMPTKLSKRLISHSNSKLIVNAVGFQLVWFACVSANTVVAVLATVLFLVVHFSYVLQSKKEIYLILTFALTGWLLDSIIAHVNLIDYTQQLTLALKHSSLSFAPVWLFCLWLGFAATLSHCRFKWSLQQYD